MNFRDWLARLSFSFFILGAVLAWTGYKAMTDPALNPTTAQLTFNWIGAVLCFILGAIGVRERHQ